MADEFTLTVASQHSCVVVDRVSGTMLADWYITPTDKRMLACTWPAAHFTNKIK